jgi:2-oxo-4-hydroxy-4-carboxy-5-ureidoimidazoline decarboxylase
MHPNHLARRDFLAAAAFVAALATAAPSMSVAQELDLAAINAMDQATFVETFGGIFENSPWVAEQAWAARPFDSIDDLHQKMFDVIAGASREQQVEFLNQHPELAGKEAQAGTMTESSVAEQASAGLNALSPEEMQTLAEGNAAYREKFGFPFMIFVRGHTKEGIFFYLDRRLQNDPSTDEELKNALTQVHGITRSRIQRVVEGT